jgi:CheY-like chemotaxis protein
LIRANLEATGLQVREAVSVSHALRLLPDVEPDLVLLSVDGLGAESVEALDAVRVRLAGRSVPIVALSSEAPSHRLLRSGQLDSWLQKPFAVPALIWQVQRALNVLPAVDESLPGGT